MAFPDKLNISCKTCMHFIPVPERCDENSGRCRYLELVWDQTIYININDREGWCKYYHTAAQTRQTREVNSK